MGGLRNQRVRWDTGLLDNLRMHRRMFGRPRFGAAGSAAAPSIDEVGFRRYRAKDLAFLTAWGLLEALWFRPALAWWRVKATFLALIGRRPGWGTIPRGAAILERPAESVAPLTR
jgi:hypothetical protein